VNGQLPTEKDRLEFERRKEGRDVAAPAMIVYALFLLAGFAMSLSISDTGRRMLASGFAGLGAVGILVFQLATGFPIVNGIPRGEANWKYTPWFWLSVAATFGAFLAAFGTRLMSPTQVKASTVSESDRIRPA